MDHGQVMINGGRQTRGGRLLTFKPVLNPDISSFSVYTSGPGLSLRVCIETNNL